MIFEFGVLHFLPKCASNGLRSNVFCLDILKRCIIAYSDVSSLNFLFSYMIIDIQ